MQQHMKGCVAEFGREYTIVNFDANGNIIPPLRQCDHVTWRSINIHERSSRNDVAIFARHRFRELARSHDLQDWPEEGEMIEFLKRAGGLFVWASVACDYIAESVSPREELDDLLQETLIDTDAVVRMDKLYATILRNCPWEQRRFTERFQTALGIVVISARPLSAGAIADLLDIDSMLDIYKPLAAIISGVFSSGQPLQVVHLSVREYVSDRAHKSAALSDVSLEDQQKWAINEPQHHQTLALCCLRMLNKELWKFRSATKFLMNTSRPPGDIGPIKGGDISEALQHACDFWIHHLVAAPSLTSELDAAIKQLSRENVLMWIAICAAEGTFQSLKRVREWYKVSASCWYVDEIRFHGRIYFTGRGRIPSNTPKC